MTAPAPPKLKVLDLFSGCGGFSLGLESTGGFETAAFCEIDPFARSIIATHWPGIIRYPDVRTVTAERLRRDGISHIDMVCAGSPCQDISISGQGAGIDGSRSGLWREVARLVGEIRPRFLLMENVAALTVRGLGSVLGELASLGLDGEWNCIPASYLGAWSRRDRIWILAYPRGFIGEGVQARPVFRQPQLSRKLSRGFEKWPGRAHLPASRLCRTDDGVPYRLERSRVLGNTVVPQIPELFGYAILDAIERQHCLSSGAIP